MSEDLVNKITLHYLTKSTKLVETGPVRVDRHEKKFYRKRIYNLSRDLLSSRNIANEDVRSAFDNYVNTCIYYFKSLDINDILQEEYKNIIPEPNVVVDPICDVNACDDANNLLVRSVKVSNASLDKFFKKKVIKTDTLVLPQQKEINLKDPTLMLKGIDKKKDKTKTKDKTKSKDKPASKKENIVKLYEEENIPKETNTETIKTNS
jgi:hypothetical protein